jgi:hypothetical protein
VHRSAGKFLLIVFFGAVALAWPQWGCGVSIEHRACVQQMLGPLVSGAASFRIDIYSSNVHCNGNAVDTKAGTPIESHSFGPSDPIKLNISPGQRTIVLTTYSDAAGTVPTGSSCTEQRLSPGGQVCFNLPVTKVARGCIATSTRCGDVCCTPINGTCNDTCGLACDPGWGNCNGDPGDGCETNLAQTGQKLCGNACISADKCCTNNDCIAYPAPAACFAGICANAGGMCSYPEKDTATICGGTCCNSIGGSCKSDCTINCIGGKGNCNGDVGDGCEVDLGTDVNNCGQCGRACLAGAANGVDTASCVNNVCTSSCLPGRSNCSRPPVPTPDDGCECKTPGCCATFCQTIHDDGFGDPFYDCVIKYEYNMTQANEAATNYNKTGVVQQRVGDDHMGDTVTAMCNLNVNDCTCWAYDATGSWSSARGHALRNAPSSNPPNADKDCLVPTSNAPSNPLWF